MINNRRNFLKKSAGVIAGAGVVSSFISKYTTGLADASTEKSCFKKENPLAYVIDMKKMCGWLRKVHRRLPCYA